MERKPLTIDALADALANLTSREIVRHLRRSKGPDRAALQLLLQLAKARESGMRREPRRQREIGTTCQPGTAPVSGEISADCVYSLAEFSRRTGLGKWAIRNLRQNRLCVRRVCGRVFVLGRDWIEFLERESQSQKHVQAGSH
jgi:hypothetical protein